MMVDGTSRVVPSLSVTVLVKFASRTMTSLNAMELELPKLIFYSLKGVLLQSAKTASNRTMEFLSTIMIYEILKAIAKTAYNIG